MGATTRNRAAAFNTGDLVTSEGLTAWNPNANSTVTALAVSSTTVYLGGSFSNISGNLRNDLGAHNRDNTISAWTAGGTNGGVSALALDEANDTLYVGGNFTQINVETRTDLASVDATTSNTVNAWDPNITGSVNDLQISGTTIYAGGNFTAVNNGGSTRNHVAAFNNTDGTVTAWDPNLSAAVNVLAINGGTIYAGGTFTMKDPTAREYLAAVNVSTGAITSFDPNLNGTVETLAIDNTTLFAGGSFTTVNDGAATAATRNHLASFDTTSDTENVTSWNPDIGGPVYTLLIEESVLYVGGNFTTVNNGIDHAEQLTRYNAAAFDYVNTTDGTASSWDPSVRWFGFGWYDDGAANVYSLKAYNDVIYIGGAFNKVNTTGVEQTRYSMTAVDTTNGIATDWDPNFYNEFIPSSVYAVEVLNGLIYAGGDFTIVNTDENYNRLVALDPDVDTDNATTWNPNIGGTVRTLEGNGTMLYAGGEFTTVNGGSTYNRLAAFDTTTDTNNVIAGFNPNIDSTVYDLDANNSYLHTGGNFSTIGSTGSTDFASFALSNSTPSTPSSLGGASYVNGSSGEDTTPTLSFTLADSNNDTVQYRIQIDDSADFGTPVVDYTSALATPGASTFTVGQAAGSGTYAVGEASQTLAEASYYWRVKAIDNHGSESAYATANSGEVAFIVSTAVADAGGSSDHVPPAIPTNFIGLVDANIHVALTWIDPQPLNNDLDYVQIYKGTNGASAIVPYKIVDAGIETFTDTSVSIGETVKYAIKSVDTSGNDSKLSQELTIIVQEGVTESAPDTPAEEQPSEEPIEPDSTWEDEMALVIKWGILTKEYEKASNKCEALVMLTRVAQLAEAEGWDVDQTVTDDGFDDTPLWCKPYAKLAKDKGLVEGRTPTELGTQGSVNRYEVAMMLARVLGATEADMETAAELDLYDDEIVDWAKGAVNWLNEQGVMTGYPDITFDGEKATIKIELAVAFARAFDLFNKLQ